MCFSAGASFGASALLLVGSVAIIKKTKQPNQLMFAAIPLIFSIQQFTEGFVWLSFQNPGYLSLRFVSSHIFLFIALVVWPIWVPVSILKLEENPNRKKILTAMSVIGSMISAFLIYSLVFEGYEPKVFAYHIQYYHLSTIKFIPLSGLIYFIPTVVTPFVSSVKRMKYFGLIMLTSYIVSNLFFRESVISIWCYFAAIMSVSIYFILEYQHKFLKINNQTLSIFNRYRER